MWSEASVASPRRHAWLRVDVIVALIALVILLPSSIAILTEPATRPEPWVLSLMIALYVVLHLTTLLAVRHPVVALAIANVVMCALVLVPGIRAASGALLPSAAAYLLVIGQVAAQTRTTVRVLALAGGIFGAGLIAFTELRLDDPELRLGAFLGLSGAIAAAWALGLVLRVRRDQAEERMAARVSQAIADERGRINRDLHDIVAHSMTVMIAQAEVARTVRAEDPDRSDAALGIVVDTGREALRGMRSVVADDAPRQPLPTVDSLEELVEGVRTPSTDVRLSESGTRAPLRADAALALHHAVREALTNAIRHNAPPVAIELHLDWRPDSVHATVRDDGGSGPVVTDLGSGVGLVGITERVRLAGGALTAHRRDPRGWIVTVDLPTERSIG